MNFSANEPRHSSTNESGPGCSQGIRGEAALFDGHLVQLENETDSRWTWGGVNSSIQGKSSVELLWDQTGPLEVRDSNVADASLIIP